MTLSSRRAGMAGCGSIVTEHGIVHYETYGSGKPVVLLHGWLGSWGVVAADHGSVGEKLSHLRSRFLGVW